MDSMADGYDPRHSDDDEFPSMDDDGRRAIGADDFLERLRSRSCFLHVVIAVCALGWATNALTLMTVAFFDTPHWTIDNSTTFVTVSEEYELTGERSYLREFMSSSFMVGNVIGGLVISPMSDALGRRPILVAGLLGLSMSTFLTTIATAAEYFITARIMQGIFYTGLGQTSWVLAYECCPIKMRSITAFLFGMFWVAGYLAIALVAILATTWRMMMLIVTGTTVAVLVAVCIIVPESLHFLVTHKADSPALDEWAQRVNEPLFIVPERRPEKIGFCNILSYLSSHHTIFRTMVMAGLWCSDAFVYFGLSFYSTKISDENTYLDYILLGIVEIPAYLLTQCSLNGFSRRAVMVGTHLMAAVSFIVLLFLPKGSYFALAGWTLGKLGISIAYMGLYVVGSEIFPTKVRVSCLGICGIFSRLGGVFAPYDRYSPKLPLAVFILVSLFGSALSVFLPETKDKPLSEHQAISQDETPVGEEVKTIHSSVVDSSNDQENPILC